MTTPYDIRRREWRDLWRCPMRNYDNDGDFPASERIVSWVIGIGSIVLVFALAIGWIHG